MRYKDIMKTGLKESEGATCAASVATVTMPFFMGTPEAPKKKPKAKKATVIRRS